MIPYLKQQRIMGALLLLAILLAGYLATFGKHAFKRKPTLVLVPIHAPKLTTSAISDIRFRIERELAIEGTHSIYPKSLIENFYLEKDNETGVFDGTFQGKKESFALGRELGVERIATATVLEGVGYVSLYLTIYDIATDQVVSRATIESPDIESLIGWTDNAGLPIDLKTALGNEVAGIGISGRLYMFWLAAILLASILLLFGKSPTRIYIELLLASGGLLALVSWVYALNGDMDYVQRFVATSGFLNIGDTSRERTATLVRYLALLILLGLLWCQDGSRRIRKAKNSLTTGNFSALIEVSAPFWAILTALLYSFSLPNFLILQGIPILAWGAAAPLYLALRRVNFGRGLFLVMLFVGLQSLIINCWQGTFSYVSLPFTVSIMMIQSLPFAALLALSVGKFRRTGLWAAPLLWVGWDWVCSFGFLGYPWGLLGVSQYAHSSLIQLAAFGGVWMVNFLPHFFSAVLAQSVESIALGNRDKLWRPLLAPFATIVGIFAIALGGALVIRQRDFRSANLSPGDYRSVRILINQQNTDPRKHDYQQSFNELKRLTEEAMAIEGPFDLVVWPESGFVPDIRYWLDESRAQWRRGKLVRTLLDWQKELRIPLVTGNQDHFFETASPSENSETSQKLKHIQNAALYLPPNRRDDYQRTYYYKMRLVPFTENFPYREQFPWVAELLHNFSTTQWTPGSEHTLLEAPSFLFSTPICFEDVFPDHMRRFVLAGSELFVNLSNDYWANTPLEGYQHGAHALFRAIENRRPLVRSTSSGWSISVDSEGRIADGWPPFYQAGWTVGEHRLPNDPEWTFYTRHGDWFPLFTLILMVLLLCGELFMSIDFPQLLRRRLGYKEQPYNATDELESRQE